MSLFILGYSLAYILDGELDSPLRGLKLGSIFILSPSPVSLFQISFSFISLDYFLYLNILSFYIGLLFWIITRGKIRDYMIWEFGRNIYSWCLRDFWGEDWVRGFEGKGEREWLRIREFMIDFLKIEKDFVLNGVFFIKEILIKFIFIIFSLSKFKLVYKIGREFVITKNFILFTTHIINLYYIKLFIRN